MSNSVKNPIFHSRTKHFDMHFHFTHEKVNEGLVEVLHIPGDIQLADILTKPLSRIKFERCRNLVGVFLVPGIPRSPSITTSHLLQAPISSLQ